MNCKPGDLAYLVRVDDPRFSENIGRVVTVTRLAGVEDCWWVDALPPGLLGYRDGNFGYSTEGWVRDSNLRPISGVPVTDDVRDEVTA